MNKEHQKYCQNLYDISKRMEVVAKHLCGKLHTEYLVTEVEFISLQFRKIFELIALSSLVANKSEYSKIHEKFATHYNARLILQDLKRINPKFYPIPIFHNLKEVNGKGVHDLKIIEDGFLTQEDLLKAYEKCGGMMHAENPYGAKRDLNQIRSEFSLWFEKLKVLLNHHLIELVDGETFIIGLMEGEKQLPEVHELKVAWDEIGNDIDTEN